VNYDRFPYVAISGVERDCAIGWAEIAAALCGHETIREARRVVVECYPGTDVDALIAGLSQILSPVCVFKSEDAFLPEQDLYAEFEDDLGDDPVFAMMSASGLEEFFDPARLHALREQIDGVVGRSLIVGVGAALVVERPDVLVYADLARWEIQRRQRKNEIGNLGLANKTDSAAQKYKRAFFLDWRLADRLKQRLLGDIDFLIDADDERALKMITGEVFRSALRAVMKRPFRVVPFFDPGPWGGHWMKEKFDLPENGSNYAWCFDCVPEENSLLLGFGERRFEIPALDVVLFQPVELLGQAVYRAFGAEFPIRFDYLDTVGGGNLSLQVHPLRSYIREKFGVDYTQDESYYMFAAESDATVYLGLKENADPLEFERDLRLAQVDTAAPFPAETYVNVWPAKRHDHFLIPAGTVHCSGRNGVVLEISATPYIFTFKLWDWGRLGLDGKPRPVHLDHGLANVQMDRRTDWVRSELINKFERLAEGDGWVEERTGLHELEFIETRRRWFTKTTPHDTRGTVHVLNLVEGNSAVVESPSEAFEPFEVRYGETFIVPAAVGKYTIRPGVEDGTLCATMQAFVRADSLPAEDAMERPR
jgi:mannose-6-phosphate isomerase class I